MSSPYGMGPVGGGDDDDDRDRAVVVAVVAVVVAREEEKDDRQARRRPVRGTIVAEKARIDRRETSPTRAIRTVLLLLMGHVMAGEGVWTGWNV